jgi:hypothetical protein
MNLKNLGNAVELVAGILGTCQFDDTMISKAV